MRKTSIRLVWAEETPGEAPGCASISPKAPVAEKTTGIRLLNGTTQVQLSPSPLDLFAALRVLPGFATA